MGHNASLEDLNLLCVELKLEPNDLFEVSVERAKKYYEKITPEYLQKKEEEAKKAQSNKPAKKKRKKAKKKQSTKKKSKKGKSKKK